MKISILLFSLLYFFNCGSENDFRPDEVEVGNEEIISARELKSFDLAGPLELPPPAQEEITQKIVKNGGLDFRSDDIERDYMAIKSSLSQFDAYIENESQNNSDYQLRYNLNLRVPAERYDNFFAQLESIAGKVENKFSNSQDVTERYYDLETRIKNKKELEARYLDILKKATAVRDILEVERNLNEVRTDIERLQGQFNYLSKQVSMSSIRVGFYEDLPYSYDANPRKGFFARVMTSLNDGWQGFLSFIVKITSLWPFLIITGLVIGLFIKYRRNKKSRA